MKHTLWVLVAQSSPLFVTLWTMACQAPLSTGFSRQEYWSGLPFPPTGVLSDPENEAEFTTLLADSLPSEPSGKLKTYIEVTKVLLS